MAKYVRADDVAMILGVPVNDVALLVAKGMPEEARDKFDPTEVANWFLAQKRREIFDNAKRVGVKLG